VQIGRIRGVMRMHNILFSCNFSHDDGVIGIFCLLVEFCTSVSLNLKWCPFLIFLIVPHYYGLLFVIMTASIVVAAILHCSSSFQSSVAPHLKIIAFHIFLQPIYILLLKSTPHQICVI
jgi:hypothetical protein